MHPHLHSTDRFSGNTEVLDPISQLFGEADVSRRDAANALGVGLLKLQRYAKRDSAHDRQLVGRINAFHIKRRICFGVTQLLRLLKHFRKLTLLGRHFGKNKISCSVDDACEPLDVVGCQPLPQGLDYRNSTSYGAFKRERDFIGARQRKQLVASFRNQGFVRCHHMFAVAQGALDHLEGHIVATHGFHHHINLRI